MGLPGSPERHELCQPGWQRRPRLPPKRPARPGTDLVVGNGFGKPGTVQLQVNIRQLVQQLLWFKAVLLRVFNFQVTALGAAELLKIKVQHCGQSGSKFLGNQQGKRTFHAVETSEKDQNSHFSGGRNWLD